MPAWRFMTAEGLEMVINTDRVLFASVDRDPTTRWPTLKVGYGTDAKSLFYYRMPSMKAADQAVQRLEELLSN